MSRYVPKHLRQAGAENAEVYAPGHTPSTGAEIKSVTYEHGVAAADAYGKTTASNPYVQGGPFSYYEDLCSWPSTAPQLTGRWSRPYYGAASNKRSPLPATGATTSSASRPAWPRLVTAPRLPRHEASP